MDFEHVGIVGMGFVGRYLQTLFGKKAVPIDVHSTAQERRRLNACAISFVCVPTPSRPDGSCDVSAVEECVGWIGSPYIVIRSTVEPGTTDRLRQATGKQVLFQPEFVGETPGHPFSDPLATNFLALGGPACETSFVADLYKQYYHSNIRFYFTEAIVAELAKYMDNAFWATVVTFCNEFFDIAAAHGVDYNVLREIWLSDTRVSRDHTFVYPNSRGFAGKCLPKDLRAIIASSTKHGYSPELLGAVMARNQRVRGKDSAVGSSPGKSEEVRT